jgi:hypothetical protein
VFASCTDLVASGADGEGAVATPWRTSRLGRNDLEIADVSDDAARRTRPERAR